MLEIFSYVYFYPTALIGPSFEFIDFKKFMNLEDEYETIDYGKCTLAGIETLFYAFFFGFIVTKFGKYLDSIYCTTDEYANKNMIYKYLYFFLTVSLIRYKYYVGWLLSQGCLNLCGFTYNKVKVLLENGKEKEVITFDRIENCSFMKIELANSPATQMQYWNRSVHLWLKNYIFIRTFNLKNTIFYNNTGLCTFVTFITSAFWHGFYLNYYIFFVHMFLIEQVCKFLHQKYNVFNTIKASGKFIPKFFSWLIFLSFMAYHGMCFTIHSIEGNLKFYKSFYFIPNIILFSMFIYGTFFGSKRKSKKETEKETTKTE
jgi:lysophospholipid acyltransferase